MASEKATKLAEMMVNLRLAHPNEFHTDTIAMCSNSLAQAIQEAIDEQVKGAIDLHNVKHLHFCPYLDPQRGDIELQARLERKGKADG